MTRVTVELLVALKGADLAAATAATTLTSRMGFADQLAGLKRFDLFRFHIESAAPGETIVENLKRTLDRQSTFYNRNKHLYALECRWEGNSHRAGFTRDDIRGRWTRELAKTLQRMTDRDFDGKRSGKPVTFGVRGAYLAEVLVEDHDESARSAIAARVQRDLGDFRDTGDADVVCHNRATQWWLALVATGVEEARETAARITVTDRRETGLLMNPHYQRAEFTSVEEIGLVSS